MVAHARDRSHGRLHDGTASKRRVRYAAAAAVSTRRVIAARSRSTRDDALAHSRSVGSAAAQGLCPLVGAAGTGARRRRCAVYGASCAPRRSTSPAQILAEHDRFAANSADKLSGLCGAALNAIVICVDVDPSIRLWSGREIPELPNGRALIGLSHDYKRNGTSTLSPLRGGHRLCDGGYMTRRRLSSASTS